MLTKEMISEFALMKQIENMKDMKALYDCLKPINAFEKWYEELAMNALKKIKEKQK